MSPDAQVDSPPVEAAALEARVRPGVRWLAQAQVDSPPSEEGAAVAGVVR